MICLPQSVLSMPTTQAHRTTWPQYGPHQRADCRLAATDDSKVGDLINTAGHFRTDPHVRLIVTDVPLSYVKYEPRTSCRSKVINRNRISVPFGPIRYLLERSGPSPPAAKYELRIWFVQKLLTPHHYLALVQSH
jgi:hypothetical protein